MIKQTNKTDDLPSTDGENIMRLSYKCKPYLVSSKPASSADLNVKSKPRSKHKIFYLLGNTQETKYKSTLTITTLSYLVAVVVVHI